MTETQNARVFRLADIAGLAQLQFQQMHSDIDPIIGVNQQMRAQGFAVDLLTIECAASKRRITFLLDDSEPESVRYQFGVVGQDPGSHFDYISQSQLDQQALVSLMEKALVR